MKIKLLLILVVPSIFFGQNKILFDASKGQEAGNADWVIDADLFNLGVGSTGPYVGGSDSNPQRYPTPLQSTITAATAENYWTGALSYWAIDCVKKGYTVETLPWNGQITYGVTTNAQDLSNYKVFIVDEPNILFTAAQKTALINFVNNGGGLFMIADHDVSDRNGDGFDSPHIWNDLMTTNSLGSNPFGFLFDYVDFTQTTSNIPNLPTNPLLHGTAGNVTQVKFSGGTTMTLNLAQNSSIKGVVYKTGAANTGVVNVMCAYGTYGLGKFVTVGDSSIAEDGTGDSGDVLYDGYITDAAGNHQKLLMNATIWLMTPTLGVNQNSIDNTRFTIAPNPIVDKQIHFSFVLDEVSVTAITLYDSLGRIVKQTTIESALGINNNTIDVSELQSGIYICKLNVGNESKSLQVLIN
jgi:Secretion system C-terminal sorting domain